MDNLPTVNLPHPPASPPSLPPLKTKWWIAGGTLLGVIVILFAFYFFRSTLFPPAPTFSTQSSQETSPNPTPQPKALIFRGTITKINGSALSVTDDKGQSNDYPISSNVIIYKYKEDSPESSASSDLKSIEEGKQASLVLELINGRYQITSISYPPPPK